MGYGPSRSCLRRAGRRPLGPGSLEIDGVVVAEAEPLQGLIRTARAARLGQGGRQGILGVWCAKVILLICHLSWPGVMGRGNVVQPFKLEPGPLQRGFLNLVRDLLMAEQVNRPMSGMAPSRPKLAWRQRTENAWHQGILFT